MKELTIPQGVDALLEDDHELVTFDGDENQFLEDAGEESVAVETEATKQMRVMIKGLLDKMSETYWNLAEALNEVMGKKLYKVWGYSSFEKYLTEECNLKRAKGYALAKIFTYFNTTLKTQFLDEPKKYDAIMDEVKNIGWSKAFRLATDKVITKDNADQVLKVAKLCSLDELEDKCKSDFAKKILGDTEKEEDVQNTVKEVRRAFSLNIHQNEAVDQAIEKALGILKAGAGLGSALSFICEDFIQSNVTVVDSKGANRNDNIAEFISKYERLLNASFILLNEDGTKVIFGYKRLKKLVESIDDISEVESKKEDDLINSLIESSLKSPEKKKEEKPKKKEKSSKKSKELLQMKE